MSYFHNAPFKIYYYTKISFGSLAKLWTTPSGISPLWSFKAFNAAPLIGGSIGAVRLKAV